ncbi:DUF4238 domain-containing protein [Agrobacterium pusense]|uniref:DUF4238 domain-containing protein n=1 Tax=Agrobacterium pusense TaxID=648995 RepID=UPI000D37F6FC|nr:DUF4238 domain-containing protein [Agrobacterium pusense]PTV70220.1 hypothetical protein DBL06_25490 [Agrobacterium pusense]
MKSANPPIKHHYIPAFYLRRWAVAGKVIQFMKVPSGEIKPLSRAPEATGFENRLYEMKGHDPTLAQRFEELYFKPLDTKAAESLELLYRHGHLAPWTPETRSDWTRFMLSLLLRCPEDIKMFRDWWTEDFGRTDPETEAKYRQQRQPGAPETFSEFLIGQPERVREAAMFTMLNTLLEGESVGTHINQMHWRVLQTPASAPLLLTSDRPVIRTNGLDSAGSHIALPIGPRFLFIASHDTQFLQGLLKANQMELVKECNRQVVGSAVRFVFASDERQKSFIQKWFGKQPQPRLMESIVGNLRKAKGPIF